MKQLFHDEEDGPAEPVHGLPEALPEGEKILWQGKPDALTLAIHVFHVRFIAAYFALMTLWRLAYLSSTDAPADAMAGAVTTSLIAFSLAMGLVFLLAWAMARAAVFTITDKRVVLRFGVAIRKYVNLPFSRIASASLRQHGRGKGDIAMVPSGPGQVGYLHLWPFVRPMRFGRPEPMLRAIPDAKPIAELLMRAVEAASDHEVTLSAGLAETSEVSKARPPIAVGAHS